MTGIGWGIMNRVKGKTGPNPYADVIFGKSQFRTSFSGKKENSFAEAFLCPSKSQKYLSQTISKVKSAELYKRAQDLAEKIVAEYEAPKNMGCKNLLNVGSKPCVEFYGLK